MVKSLGEEKRSLKSCGDDVPRYRPRARGHGGAQRPLIGLSYSTEYEY